MRSTRFLRSSLAVLYFLLCCYLFFLPGKDLPQEDWLDRIYFDKWVHVGLFAVLALLLCWCGFAGGRRMWVGLACVAYGGAVELIQGAWVPNRSMDIFDWISDSVGVLLGLYMAARLAKKNKPL